MLQKPLWNYIHSQTVQQNQQYLPKKVHFHVLEGRLRQQNLASTCSVYSHFLNWMNHIKRINDLCYKTGKKSPSGFPTGRMAFLQEIQVILEEKTPLPKILTFLSWLSYSSRSSPALLNLMGALNIKSGKKRGKKKKSFLVQDNWCWPLFPKKGEISRGCTRASAALFQPQMFIFCHCYHSSV